MKSKRAPTIPTLVAILSTATCVAIAQTEVLKFDDLPAPAFNGASVIPNNYGGLLWQNFNYVDGLNVEGSPSGYANAIVSGTNVAFNAGSKTATITGPVFSLTSAYVTGAWRDGLQVEVQGYVGATLTYDNTYTVGTSGPSLINFNYVGVDEVIFASSAGTKNPLFHDPVPNAPAEEFALHNLSITIGVPEPSTFALTALAMAMAMGGRRSTAGRLG